MPTSFKNGFFAGLLLAFVVALWLTRLWGAENQVRLHSEHLLREVETHDWSAVADFLAADYHDDWGNDRAQLIVRLRLVSRLISSLTIAASNTDTRVRPPKGLWRAHLSLGGKGEAAPEITARVNRLTTSFEFDWRLESWRPWDWKLVGVRNSSLELPTAD